MKHLIKKLIQFKQWVLSIVINSYPNKKDDFYKNIMKDWGKEDVYGPWTNRKTDGKLRFYKSYYLITTNKKPDIDMLNKK
jgi:hypothetical protein